ncbi:MAG TPA: hypothetical protein VFZ65_10780 [Planctomycetota bacterium]|nr:hypothetical protein [Planctomycetota bacterium]
MTSLRKLTSHLALSAACLLGIAAPNHAQTTPIGAGAGAFVAANQATHVFVFSIVERADGTVRGRVLVLEPATHGFVSVELSSYMYVGTTLAAAGTITAALNAPPQYPVGGTAFFAVNDNTGAPDGFAGLGAVPPQFGSLTVQQIINLIGPPPPQAFAPLLAGNVWIF